MEEMKKRNPKIAEAFDVFERTEEVFDRTIEAVTPYYRPVQRGTYSSAVSKKDYHANISTTTQ